MNNRIVVESYSSRKWFPVQVICPHCKSKTWKMVLKGKQMCPDCGREIKS